MQRIALLAAALVALTDAHAQEPIRIGLRFRRPLASADRLGEAEVPDARCRFGKRNAVPVIRAD